MQTRRTIQPCACIVLTFVPIQVLFSQNEAAQDGVEVTSKVETNGNNFGFPSGKPFIALWKRTSTSRKQDGATVTTIDSVKGARDSGWQSLF
jgi:hypothetical protein